MNKRKRILSLVVALAFVLTTFAQTTFAADASVTDPEETTTVSTSESDGNYTLEYTSEEAKAAGYISFGVNDEEGISIYKYNAAVGGVNVKIPSAIDGIPVTTIEEEAFGPEGYTTNMKIETVTMPDTVTYLGFANFYYDRALTSIRLSENLEFIGYNCFMNCTSLKSIYIPASVKEIEARAFNGSGIASFEVAEGSETYAAYEGAIYSKDYKTLYFYPITATEFSVHEDTEVIFENAAYTCKSLTEVDLTDSKVTEIQDGAFESCTALTTVKLPGLETLGLGAFYLDKKITTFTIEEGGAYKVGKDGITIYTSDGKTLVECLTGASGTVTVADGTETLSDVAFYGCSGITEIVLPDGLQKIGTEDTLSFGTFSGCSNLTTINIPEGVKSLHRNAFYGCNNLSSIHIPTSVTYIHPRALMNYGLEDITVDEGNSSYMAEDGALYTSDGKTLVKYPAGRAATSYTVKDGVEVIGEAAFYRAANLTEVTLPDSVKELDAYAFYITKNMTTLNMSENLETIGEYCFNQCTALTSIRIPAAVTDIGQYAFYYCSAMTEIDVDEDNETYAGYDGVLYNKDLTTLLECPGGKTQIEIASTTTMIGERSFWHCTKLTSLVIPEGVTAIGGYAFYQCTALGEVTLPASLASVGGNAFANSAKVYFLVEEGTTAEAYCKWAGYDYTILYTITFDANGGTCDTETAQNNSEGKLDSLPTATKSGYVFLGWYDSVSGGEKITEDTVFTADTTVYAQWKAVSSSNSSGNSSSSTENALKDAQKNAVEELENYVSLSDYDDEGQTAVKAILAEAEKNINAAKTESEVSNIVSKAKSDIDAVNNDTSSKIKTGVENTTIKLWSTFSEKNNIQLNWTKSEGYKVDYYQVYKSTKRYSGYGTKAYYQTSTGLKNSYINTKELKKGTRYFYKVRGVRVINGEKVYTQWSNKAWRIARVNK